MKILETFQSVSIIVGSLILLFNYSFTKDEDTDPGLNIYKTKGDYFLFVNTWRQQFHKTTS